MLGNIYQQQNRKEEKCVKTAIKKITFCLTVKFKKIKKNYVVKQNKLFQNKFNQKT